MRAPCGTGPLPFQPKSLTLSLLGLVAIFLIIRLCRHAMVLISLPFNFHQVIWADADLLDEDFAVLLGIKLVCVTEAIEAPRMIPPLKHILALIIGPLSSPAGAVFIFVGKKD